VLLIQGDDDRNVPFAEMVDLAEALRKQGVPFDQLVFPDEIHDFLLHRTWLGGVSTRPAISSIGISRLPEIGKSICFR